MRSQAQIRNVLKRRRGRRVFRHRIEIAQQVIHKRCRMHRLRHQPRGNRALGSGIQDQRMGQAMLAQPVGPQAFGRGGGIREDQDLGMV